MRNPWQDLPEYSPYLLEFDHKVVLSHNARVENDYKFKYDDVLPEPYLGRPDAPVMLLNLNPGFKDEDIIFYGQDLVRKLWRKNILHEEMEYPFYLLDTSLDPKLGGTKWWRKKLKELITTAGVKIVANNICCVEFFPYHSLKYKSLKAIIESQKYSFYLVEQAIQNGVAIIIMRSEKQWFSVVPQLSHYKRLYRLNNVQSPYISRKNCPIGFPVVERLLCG